jgi:hypothetical protein
MAEQEQEIVDPAVAIGAIIKQLKGPTGRPASRELSLAVTKLEEATLWLLAHTMLDQDAPAK